MRRVEAKERPPQSGRLEFIDPHSDRNKASDLAVDQNIIPEELTTDESEEIMEEFVSSNDLPVLLPATSAEQSRQHSLSMSSMQSSMQSSIRSDRSNKHELIMRKINKHVNTNRLKISSIFKQFDTSGDGMLSKVEFRKGIEAILANALFTITKLEINELFNNIDFP